MSGFDEVISYNAAGGKAIRTVGTTTITGDVNVDVSTSDTFGLVGKASGGDFTTAYASATTITVGSLPTYHSTLLAADIVSVVQIAAAGNVVATYTRDDATMTVSGATITVFGATFGATDTFVIYTNIARVTDVNGSIAHDAVDANNPVKIGGKAFDPATPQSAVAANDRVNAMFDLNGRLITYLGSLLYGEDSTNTVLQVVQKPLAVSTYTYSRDSATALEASSIAKASAGTLYRSFGTIDKSAATGLYYLLHLDSATLTADGAVTHLISPIRINHTTGTDSSYDTGHFDLGVAAANGIVTVLSTTMVTKTIVTGGNVALFGTTLYK